MKPLVCDVGDSVVTVQGAVYVIVSFLPDGRLEGEPTFKKDVKKKSIRVAIPRKSILDVIRKPKKKKKKKKKK